MKFVYLPEGRALPFYLAAEEYFAGDGYCGNVCTVWSVAPTVIAGRHQVLEKEIDLAWCASNGVNVVRRRSGGGSVYADRGNLMISCVVGEGSVGESFDRFMGAVASVLRGLGLPAEVSGRNDILIEGRKVSGCAYYRAPSARSVLHCTMLVSSDLSAVERCLTPSNDKIRSKGVDSVRSRVANLRDFMPGISVESLSDEIRGALFDGDLRPDEAVVSEIERLEQRYYDPSFFNDSTPAFSVSGKSRIEGVGELSFSIDTKSDKVEKLRLDGDFLELHPGLEEHLRERLVGLRYDRALDVLEADETISGYVEGLDGKILSDILKHTTQQ